jgi:hypothetical protein
MNKHYENGKSGWIWELPPNGTIDRMFWDDGEAARIRERDEKLRTELKEYRYYGNSDGIDLTPYIIAGIGACITIFIIVTIYKTFFIALLKGIGMGFLFVVSGVFLFILILLAFDLVRHKNSKWFQKFVGVTRGKFFPIKLVIGSDYFYILTIIILIIGFMYGIYEN